MTSCLYLLLPGLLLMLLAATPAGASAPADTVDLPETNYYEIETPYGRMVLRLYDETPVHRDNFKRLVAEAFYDSTLFHRVIGRFNAQQTNLKRLRRGGVYIPQQASFFRASLWQRVGPLDPSFYFAMDYDLWVRLAEVSELHYHPRHWANFRLHEGAKSIADDDRCWPEMIRVHRRDGGSWFSAIIGRYVLRKALAPIWMWRRRRSFRRHR